MEVAEKFTAAQGSSVIFGYHIDEEMTIKRIAGQIADASIEQFLPADVHISLNVKLLSIYKILKSEPPLPYIAEIVYSALWNNRYDYGKDSFEASKSNVNKIVKILYPPYLRSPTGGNVEQLLPGRVDKALNFLEMIEWIKQEPPDTIRVYVDKGRKILDLRKHLIEALARVKAEREPQSGRRGRKRRLRLHENGVGKRITDFIN